MKSLEELPNIATFNAWAKCERHFIDHHKILISLSGGSDSDIMLDFLLRVRQENTYNYRGEMLFVFFDTGIESQATKEHLDFLEQKYNIKIERIRAKVPVPLGCRKYGLPYFKISDKCCYGAKKKPSADFEKNNTIDLKCLGIRQAEGGIRSSSNKSCFDDNISYDAEHPNKKQYFDVYRPIFWFSDKDKKEYEEFFGVTHSRCYTEYGFKRTGCMGCPFNSKWQEDLEILKVKEPLLYKAVNNIFAKSYEYTLKYREFKKKYGGENEK